MGDRVVEKLSIDVYDRKISALVLGTGGFARGGVVDMWLQGAGENRGITPTVTVNPQNRANWATCFGGHLGVNSGT